MVDSPFLSRTCPPIVAKAPARWFAANNRCTILFQEGTVSKYGVRNA
jgi:hypothetical protein